mmetsp:Transcript_24408/g.74496  ORF Transcript_24408/g.74496 Transcript_24408/m.74496 type:complete len:205 (-) Transcript_24408:190-804(-)
MISHSHNHLTLLLLHAQHLLQRSTIDDFGLRRLSQNFLLCESTHLNALVLSPLGCDLARSLLRKLNSLSSLCLGGSRCILGGCAERASLEGLQARKLAQLGSAALLRLLRGIARGARRLLGLRVAVYRLLLTLGRACRLLSLLRHLIFVFIVRVRRVTKVRVERVVALLVIGVHRELLVSLGVGPELLFVEIAVALLRLVLLLR